MPSDASPGVPKLLLFFFLIIRPAPLSSLFAYMTVVRSCRSTRFHPAGGVIVLPAVSTITWATMTSPLIVPAGRLMVSVDATAPLLPLATARRPIPPGGGVGVGDGVAVAAGFEAI